MYFRFRCDQTILIDGGSQISNKQVLRLLLSHD